MEDKMTLKNCLKIMVDSLRILEQAKSDCDTVCLSAWDVLIEDDNTIEEKDISFKEMLKIAKSLAKRKLKKLEEEHKKLGLLLEEVMQEGENNE
ncbi:TPA: hypothetical protein DIC62_00605 [Candidatus Nomurabacteria bacterium]|nr:hypothetical protein [Candidatus Nomurabacteria bacterium]